MAIFSADRVSKRDMYMRDFWVPRVRAHEMRRQPFRREHNNAGLYQRDAVGCAWPLLRHRHCRSERAPPTRSCSRMAAQRRTAASTDRDARLSARLHAERRRHRLLLDRSDRPDAGRHGRSSPSRRSGCSSIRSTRSPLKVTPTNAARANTTSRSAPSVRRRCAITCRKWHQRLAHPDHLVWQGTPGRGLQRHLVLVAEPARADGAEHWRPSQPALRADRRTPAARSAAVLTRFSAADLEVRRCFWAKRSQRTAGRALERFQLAKFGPIAGRQNTTGGAGPPD